MIFKSLFLFFLFLPVASAQVSPGFQSQSFQYLSGILTSASPISSRATNAFSAMNPPKQYSMSVTTTATGFSVILEGSLDNSNWSQIAVTTSAIGVVSNINPIPALYLRMRATTISSGTSVTGTAIGVW